MELIRLWGRGFQELSGSDINHRTLHTPDSYTHLFKHSLEFQGFMEPQTLSHGFWQRIPYLWTLMFIKSMKHISSKFSLPPAS